MWTPSGQNDSSPGDQGTAKIIFTTRDADPRFLRHSSLVATQDFIDKYPEITHRVVKNLVLAAKWISDRRRHAGSRLPAVDQVRHAVFEL